MTKLSLETCCHASNFSSDCYGDQPVFMYVICARLMNFCFVLVGNQFATKHLTYTFQSV